MRLIDTSPSFASENMSFDKALLESLEEEPILHLYDWSEPSVTYGHFVKPEDFLNLDACQQENISLAKRPTGGGIILHLTDYAFSFLLPATHPNFSENTLENYKTVNEAVIAAIHDATGLQGSLLPLEPLAKDPSSSRFCMAKPTKYDVIINGQKVGGAAQRKTKRGLLHQGSISLLPPPIETLKKILLPKTHVLEGMKQNSFFLFKKDLEESRALVKKALIKVFSNRY